jgi:UDP:flavonoid glycosyltransferase YjiC (YdhE family)
MSRFLFATWDGAGNLVPTLALARRLSRAGHDVRVLGHNTIDRRHGHADWRFRALRHTPDFDSVAAAERPDDMADTARRLWFAGAVARDVAEELASQPADVLVADCMLFGAISAGEAARIPTVSLFHGAFALFRRGPLFDLLTAQLPALNALRVELGLSPVERIFHVHDACALSLVAGPREFEPEMPLPANVRFVGPLFDAPSAMDAEPQPEGRPLVVISFSTGQQGQAAVLQRIIDGLDELPIRAVVTTGPAIDPATLRAGSNVEIVRFVPHDRLLPQAALVVTHAGLGTVMAAMAHGVPLLCLPMGRDQFFNAARVEALGIGRRLPADAPAATIAGAVRELLGNDVVRAAAKQGARIIAGYRNGIAAVAELERLAGASSLRLVM